MKIFIYKFIVIYIIYFFGKNLFYIYHIFIIINCYKNMKIILNNLYLF